MCPVFADNNRLRVYCSVHKWWLLFTKLDQYITKLLTVICYDVFEERAALLLYKVTQGSSLRKKRDERIGSLLIKQLDHLRKPIMFPQFGQLLCYHLVCIFIGRR